jgi:hypothetical protein
VVHNDTQSSHYLQVREVHIRIKHAQRDNMHC